MSLPILRRSPLNLPSTRLFSKRPSTRRLASVAAGLAAGLLSLSCPPYATAASPHPVFPNPVFPQSTSEPNAADPPAEGKAEGEWIDLLADNQLSEHWTTTGNWSIDEAGVVRLTPREGESGWSRWSAYLWSKEEFGDFEIDFEYLVEPRGNSGFYFRVGDKNDPVAQGIEVQIYDSYSKSGDAKLTDHTSGGVIPGVPPTKNAAKPAGQWNRFQITSQDDQLTVKLNGQVVNELRLDSPKLKNRPAVGPIGFQDHGLPFALRNIKIRRL